MWQSISGQQAVSPITYNNSIFSSKAEVNPDLYNPNFSQPNLSHVPQ